MIIYTFDTGVSTGIAVLNTDDKKTFVLTLDSIGLNKFLLHDNFSPNIVVIERIPESSDYSLMNLYEMVKEFSLIHGVIPKLIAPSQWKPVAEARQWKCSQATTQHEKDAYSLLRYYLWITDKIDIGDV
jgi:hypothetical protein